MASIRIHRNQAESCNSSKQTAKNHGFWLNHLTFFILFSLINKKKSSGIFKPKEVKSGCMWTFFGVCKYWKDLKRLSLQCPIFWTLSIASRFWLKQQLVQEFLQLTKEWCLICIFLIPVSKSSETPCIYISRDCSEHRKILKRMHQITKLCTLNGTNHRKAQKGPKVKSSQELIFQDGSRTFLEL